MLASGHDPTLDIAPPPRAFCRRRVHAWPGAAIVRTNRVRASAWRAALTEDVVALPLLPREPQLSSSPAQMPMATPPPAVAEEAERSSCGSDDAVLRRGRCEIY